MFCFSYFQRNSKLVFYRFIYWQEFHISIQTRQKIQGQYCFHKVTVKEIGWFQSWFFFCPSSLFRVFIHMSGNSQSVKRPYLGHKVILRNTLLWAPEPILMATYSFYFTNTSSGRMGTQIGGPNTENIHWYMPPQ